MLAEQQPSACTSLAAAYEPLLLLHPSMCAGVLTMRHACAGLAFLAFELFLTYGPPSGWLRTGFMANPKLRKDQIEEAIRQAKSRLVGSLHLLIQARKCSRTGWRLSGHQHQAPQQLHSSSVGGMM